LFQQHLAAGHIDQVGAADALVRLHTMVARIISGTVQRIRALATPPAAVAGAGHLGGVRVALGERLEPVGDIAVVLAMRARRGAQPVGHILREVLADLLQRLLRALRAP
jgi:hypothetical protein